MLETGLFVSYCLYIGFRRIRNLERTYSSLALSLDI